MCSGPRRQHWKQKHPRRHQRQVRIRSPTKQADATIMAVLLSSYKSDTTSLTLDHIELMISSTTELPDNPELELELDDEEEEEISMPVLENKALELLEEVVSLEKKTKSPVELDIFFLSVCVCPIHYFIPPIYIIQNVVLFFPVTT